MTIESFLGRAIAAYDPPVRGDRITGCDCACWCSAVAWRGERPRMLRLGTDGG